ncbi:hypothetical protein [Candidatus Desulforudis audaxviator]|uniref:CRISPR-associated protein, Cst1 family n=1 Tax=Desulforudis audaxviator (strain MP104C) TaxID=477974 RepID=B1I4N5_DESAP|nr:hypothetical protein [Candidatus Desulforudis audaxviator]ACA59804.1 hypothetical protein Daud_1293 [Candidatus Desulforudis audaxviator MP104C]
MLTWTGHPLVDVGIATLCVMCRKNDPRDLTMEDLDSAADRMAEYYFSGLMTSYNACVFTMNAYDNPTSGPEKRKEYENRVLRAHRSMPDSGAKHFTCPFSGKPATHLIERRQMPLLTGENVLNFYPEGHSFLPIFGPYLVALQALPLGGRRAEGRLLIAHGDDPAITLAFAERYLADNQRLLNLAKSGTLPRTKGPSLDLEREQAAGTSKHRVKYPDAKAPATLIMNDLMDIYRVRMGNEFRTRRDVSVTAYWLSNSGQGPSLEIFHLPIQVTRFLTIVDAAPYGIRWRSLVAKAWRRPYAQETPVPEGKEENKGGGRKKRDTQQLPGGPGRSRNDVIADLFAIYEHGFMDLGAARNFLRRHLRGDTPVSGVVKLREPKMTDWSLTKIFLKEVMGVDERRIEAIKQFADRLADHISQTNDKGLFRDLVYGQRPWEVRNALTKAQRNQAKDHGRLLFGLDEYLDVFEADHAVGRSDWSLSRDLISIRLVEQLYGKGFFGREDNRELLAEPEIQVDEETN